MQSRTSSRGLALSAIIMCALALTLTHVPSFAFADDQPTTEPVVETEAVETVDPEAAAPAAEEGTANEQEVADETATAEETEVVEEEQTPEIPALLPLADPGAEIVEGDYFIETGQMLADKTGLQWLVLDAKGGKIVSGTRIITWSYSGNENQRWHVAPDGTGRYIISAYKDHDMVITATAESGRLVLTKYVPGLASQLWNFMPYSTAYGNGYQIVPSGIQKSAKDTTITELAPAKAMDVRGNSTKRGADIMTYTASSTIKGNQTYYLTPYPVKTPTEGVTDLEGKYRISVPGTNVLVEINKASTANGANVALYTGNGKAHQDIFLRHEGNGFYSIWDMGTNKVLDVRASKILPGTNILQWAYKGTDNQLWAARKNDDGTYTFINKATGLAMGVGSETKGASGNNIVGCEDNGRANNCFNLQSVPLATAGIYKIKGIENTKVLDVSKASTADGATLSFYTDNSGMNQRFELVPTGENNVWRIRTASSGGWITFTDDHKVIQSGNHATPVTANNSWRLVWGDGGLAITSMVDGHVLGGAKKRVTLVAAPIDLGVGQYKFSSKLGTVALGVPATTAGTKADTSTDSGSDNQKFNIEKSGTGYKITNSASGLALTASGSKVTLATSSSAATQVWNVGIADGGCIKLINKSTKTAIDVPGEGTTVSGSSASVTLANDDAAREARQAWKPVAVTGWFKINGHWIYRSNNPKAKFDNDINTSGKNLGHYDVVHDIWSKIQGQSSRTRYLIASSWDSCYLAVFEGSKGNWKPLFGWNCGNGNKQMIDSKATARGSSSRYIINWNYELALWNTSAHRITGLNSSDLTLGTTWAASRRRKITPQEQYFTSIWWTLGYHTYLASKSELGKHISNGCQRLPYEGAKWIYENVAPGTRCIQLRTKAY